MLVFATNSRRNELANCTTHLHYRGGFIAIVRRPHEPRKTSVKQFRILASLAMTPKARAQQIQSDTEKRAHDLDLKYPGKQAPRSHKFSSLMVKMADTSNWSSALLPIFLTTSWSRVTFSDELVPSKRFTAGTLAMNRHILVSHYGQLGFFGFG